MSRLQEIGEQDGWRCWLCDAAVDPQMSVNDSRGPSIDSMATAAKAARGKSSRGQAVAGERLAHRGCNTKKGAVAPVIGWPDRLFVSDPAPLFGVAERLKRKPGREVVARCPSRADAAETAEWLVDRFSRLIPEVAVTTAIEAGGGQFMVVLIGGS